MWRVGLIVGRSVGTSVSRRVLPGLCFFPGGSDLLLQQRHFLFGDRDQLLLEGYRADGQGAHGRIGALFRRGTVGMHHLQGLLKLLQFRRQHQALVGQLPQRSGGVRGVGGLGADLAGK
ncbi:MAG: hypothetical protein IPG64_11825 [Haliea sp.]|nr:hypothetical protein [Haliea sp.]